jgi:hypothetical protein
MMKLNKYIIAVVFLMYNGFFSMAQSIYPQALMGYDIMMYFVPKISGSEWETESLQHGFDFVRIGENGGQCNRHLFIIQYTPQRKIISRALPR